MRLPGTTMVLATLYALPFWQEALACFAPAAVMLAALVARVLSERRWVRLMYWSLVAAAVLYYASYMASDGWKDFVPQDPRNSVYDPRWGTRFAAALLGGLMIVLSLSAPLWTNRIRRANK